MRFCQPTLGLLPILGFLVACAAPEPAPILPEPVYDKYGSAVISGGQCRPAQQPINETFPANVPVCGCGPGEAQSTGTAAANNPRCVPIRREGDDPQNPRGQTAPNIQN